LLVFKFLRPEPYRSLPLLLPARGSDPDHFLLDQSDQQNPELNTRCVLMYIKIDLIRQVWLRSLALTNFNQHPESIKRLLAELFVYLPSIMEKGKRTIIKLFIIIISFCFIDGGRSFLIFDDNNQILLTEDPRNDVEMPHQQYTFNFHDEEKWLNSFSFDFFCVNLNSIEFLFTLKFAHQEYLDSIWQPPKFV
jgi:hypothetical protein